MLRRLFIARLLRSVGTPLLLLVLALPGMSVGAPTTLPAKPLYVEVFVRAAATTSPAARDEKVSGNLLSSDDVSLTVKTAKGDRSFKWAALTPSSAFTLRSRLIDKTKAGDWLALGRFGWKLGAKDQARTALEEAIKLDPKLKTDADAVLASAPGGPVKTSLPSISPRPAPAAKPEPPRSIDKYIKSTPEDDAAAMAFDRDMTKEIEKKFKVQFTEIETAHFLIYTDWDPREYEFLKTNLEDAYTAVSDQFEIPIKENVFIGKLPVYMFARYDDFARFTDDDKGLGIKAKRELRGYYQHFVNGLGRMVMYKPAAEDGATHSAELDWAHTLTHEFTHAFIARYRTNAPIPRWLNEGTAEVIAGTKFPRAYTAMMAMQMSGNGDEIMKLFDDKNIPTGPYYPVMQSMVELLISQDHAAFLKMFDAIKDGMDPQDGLRKFYNVDYNGFLLAWRRSIHTQ